MNLIPRIFGAHGQIVVGILLFLIGTVFWIVGIFKIPNAAAWAWAWSAEVYIFHASMLALVIGGYNIIATALGYRATERVEEVIVENIENVDIDVKS
jgi:hypothetical protein